MHDDANLPSTLVMPDQPTVAERRKLSAAPAPALAGSATVAALPGVGESFVGFRLLAVLGRGAFGQVYLAEQADLAHRYVALKVARDIFGESQTLAQLQHTNIVPIYSLHRVGPVQAVCMPFFGATTLADALAQTHGKAAQLASGKVLVDTVKDRKRTTVLPPGVTPLPELPAPAASSAPNAPAANVLHQLARMSYVEAVLWIGERLADGLAHAHERGILHHDLKPANILLTEEGQPMLLDFSLSEDTKRRSDRVAVVGGTLPYMSPEHLATLRGDTARPDGRSDVYALGIVLYELLAGRLPFKVCAGAGEAPDATAAMIAERRRPPSLRAANRAVSPAVDAIIRHCMEPEPARRYQSARELQEDVRRQRHHLPLRYAREASLRELATKWARRHPRLSSTTSVALMLGMVLGVLALALWLRSRQLARLEAEETLRQFRADATSVQFLLYSRNADRGQLDDGMRRCRSTLAHFAILDNPDWWGAPAVQQLTAAERTSLRDEAGEILFLYARATALAAASQTEPAARAEALHEARRLNGLAETSFGHGQTPRALYEQRADLARLLDDPREAAACAAQAQQVPVRTARDLYLIAHQHAIHGELREALALLEQVTQDDPRNFAAWFVRGNCNYDLVQDAAAVACYNVCITLRPEFHWSWFNRGLAQLRLRQFRQAANDFDRAIRLQPDLTEGYISRGLAREGMRAYPEAIADYTQALSNPTASTRIYFLRAAARAKAGDRAGAQRDYDQGLAAAPTDELGWIARGSARRDRVPKEALADYEQALKLNPRSFEGLQNKAALLSDKFRDDAAALAVMEQVVTYYPESVLARGGRGVLLARAGRRTAAHADAQACLLLDSGAATQYQAGCIYALTAKQNADDRLQALPLLSAALRGGFGLEFVDRDSDLDALRQFPEFRNMVAAARALQR
jgi:serine/threonine protein kinase/Tfp pilus assembly protein PilF